MTLTEPRGGCRRCPVSQQRTWASKGGGGSPGPWAVSGTEPALRNHADRVHRVLAGDWALWKADLLDEVFFKPHYTKQRMFLTGALPLPAAPQSSGVRLCCKQDAGRRAPDFSLPVTRGILCPVGVAFTSDCGTSSSACSFVFEQGRFVQAWLGGRRRSSCPAHGRQPHSDAGPGPEVIALLRASSSQGLAGGYSERKWENKQSLRADIGFLSVKGQSVLGNTPGWVCGLGKAPRAGRPRVAPPGCGGLMLGGGAGGSG